jgi:hypothetical protein
MMTMNENYDAKNLTMIGDNLRTWLAIIWPLLLLITWVLIIILALETNVFHYIPETFRVGIKRLEAAAVPGLVQDPFYTIWQFFWIPAIFVTLKAFRSLPIMVNHFIDQNYLRSTGTNTGVEIKNELENIIDPFKEILYSKWQWLFAIILGLLAMGLQINTQISRIQEMNIMYWWDWRINKVIYIVRFIMVGLDMFFAGILVYRWLLSVRFIKTFLDFVTLTPRPLQPDNAAGLSIIGKVCFNFTLPVVVGGMVLSMSFILHEETSYKILNFSTLAIITLCLFFVFFFPLIKVHKKMKKVKKQWLREISLEFYSVMSRLESNFCDKNFNMEPLFKRMEHLTHYEQIIKKMPSWPFNTKTLSHFLSTASLPLLMLVIEFIVRVVIK